MHNEYEVMQHYESHTNSVVKQLNFQPFVLSALASFETNRDLSELPEWVQNIITKMTSPPAMDFDADYKTVPMTIEADYKFSLSSHDEAVIRFAKVELDRLCKQIQKSNINTRGKRVTDKDIYELYQNVLFNDLLKLSSNIGSVRQQIEHVHTIESYKLTEAIKGAKCFTEAQKSLMLMTLAAYTKDVSTILECFSCMGNQINT